MNMGTLVSITYSFWGTGKIGPFLRLEPYKGSMHYNDVSGWCTTMQCMKECFTTDSGNKQLHSNQLQKCVIFYIVWCTNFSMVSNVF